MSDRFVKTETINDGRFVKYSTARENVFIKKKELSCRIMCGYI